MSHFYLFSSCCNSSFFSYSSVTLHVVNNIFRFRPHQSYTSFLLLLSWTAQLFFTTHTQSDIIPAFVRGDSEEWDGISGEPWSLYLQYTQQRCLFISVYTLFPPFLQEWELIYPALQFVPVWSTINMKSAVLNGVFICICRLTLVIWFGNSIVKTHCVSSKRTDLPKINFSFGSYTTPLDWWTKT